MVTARCDDCGFDPQEWDDQDSARTLARADYLLRHATAGLPGAQVPEPSPAPAGDGGSGTDRAAVHALLHRCWEAAEHLADLEHAGPEHADLEHAGPEHAGPEHAGPEHAGGYGEVGRSGTLERINRSGGGVPKTAVDEAVVGRRGVLGDRQASRRHHGRPWQALCLWSADVIDALATEGHPVEPGGTGENLTVRGVDWSRLRSGLVVTIGTVRCRLTVPAEPCRNIDGCFTGTSSRRIDHDRHPGWSRWYATVLEGGTIRTGDPVTVTAR